MDVAQHKNVAMRLKTIGINTIDEHFQMRHTTLI